MMKITGEDDSDDDMQSYKQTHDLSEHFELSQRYREPEEPVDSFLAAIQKFKFGKNREESFLWDFIAFGIQIDEQTSVDEGAHVGKCADICTELVADILSRWQEQHSSSVIYKLEDQVRPNSERKIIEDCRFVDNVPNNVREPGRQGEIIAQNTISQPFYLEVHIGSNPHGDRHRR